MLRNIPGFIHQDIYRMPCFGRKKKRGLQRGRPKVEHYSYLFTLFVHHHFFIVITVTAVLMLWCNGIKYM